MNNKENTASPPRTALGAVQVKIPSLSEHDEPAWAPCVAPMAGKDRGVFALPEVGDQVLVAFLMAIGPNPTSWAACGIQKQPPPATIDGTGKTSIVIRDQNGSEIRLDTEGYIVVETKAGDARHPGQGWHGDAGSEGR